MNKYRQVLQAMFTYACRSDTYELPSNPVDRTDKRCEPPLAALDYYEVEEVEALARACEVGAHRRTVAVTDEELAARGLSEARESEVVIQTLDQLAERFSGQLPASTFAAVRERPELARASERVRLVTATRNAEAVQDLGAARLRIEDLTLKEGGWRALEPGILRTYGRGRKGFRRARRASSLEALHAWRKRVKDLSYQLRLLAPVCGPAVRGQAKEADRLAELLGDDHDLTVLTRAVTGEVGPGATQLAPTSTRAAVRYGAVFSAVHAGWIVNQAAVKRTQNG